LENLIPEPYSKELEPLCNDCPTSNFLTVKKAIERELNRKLEDIFLEFDPVPVGSASLAQVHKAKLLDGTRVAVKVKFIFNLFRSNMKK
jgi:predicted unusual protein kinase regulating ubiquinone biosynthesis (AarF/ABC1/UbiB family)